MPVRDRGRCAVDNDSPSRRHEEQGSRGRLRACDPIAHTACYEFQLWRHGGKARKGSSAMVAAERKAVRLVCAECGTEYPTNVPRYRCDCGGLLTVEQPIAALRGVVSRELFDRRLASRARLDQSGVWRFRELLGDYDHDLIVSKPEGRGNLYDDPRLTAWAGVGALWLKHEGENP